MELFVVKSKYNTRCLQRGDKRVLSYSLIEIKGFSDVPRRGEGAILMKRARRTTVIVVSIVGPFVARGGKQGQQRKMRYDPAWGPYA